MARGGIEYSELLLQDWRFLAFVIICVVAAFVFPNQRVKAVARDRAFWMFSSLLLVGFVTWIVVFGIYRYFLFGELLVSILIVVLLSELIHDGFKAVVSVAVLGFGGLAFQTLPEWGRGDILRNDALAAIVDGRADVPSHVVFVGPPPFGYLAEAFPSDTRFAALFAYDSNELRLAGPLAEQLDSFLAAGEADDGLNVIVDAGLPALPAPLSNYTRSDCEPFESLGRPLEMCTLVRVGDAAANP